MKPFKQYITEASSPTNTMWFTHDGEMLEGDQENDTHDEKV